MKNFFTILLSIFLINAGVSQQLLFEDFNSTGGVLPAGWQSIDNDPEPHASNSDFDMWHVESSQFNTDSVIAGSSWLNPSTAVADDWLITPAVSGLTPSTMLNWKAGASSSVYTESYEVYVSTGNTITSFLANTPVFSTPAEQAGAMFPRNVSLASYAGQTVYIAFRINGSDGDILEIDDIEVTNSTSTTLNDDCANSINLNSSLGLGLGVPGISGPYDNTMATNHPTDPTTGFACFYDLDIAGAQAPMIDNSLWFTFVGDGKTYEITSTDCGGGINYIPNGDTQFALYSGSCGSLVPEDCNEDYAGAPTGFYPAGVVFPTVAGVTYYLMVDGWTDLSMGTNSIGEYCIQFTEQTPTTCSAGSFVNTSVDICTGGTGTVQITSESVPVNGGYAWLFSDSQGGTGGLAGGFYLSSATSPYTFDDGLNGVLAANNLLPLDGIWVVSGFAYTDPTDIANTICSFTSDSVFVEFNVPAPVALFNQSTSGTTVNFTNNSMNATSYSWDFGDGNSSTAVSPTHTYASSGTYTVTLTATNSCGSQQFTQAVTIGGAPVCFAGNLVTTPIDVCPNGTATVQVTTETIPTNGGFGWNFSDSQGGTGGLAGGFAISGPNPFTFDDDVNGILSANNLSPLNGTWVIQGFTFTDPNNALGTICSVTADSVLVTFNVSAPTAQFTQNTTGTTVSFTNNSNNATSYSWDFGDGNSSTAVNPTHTYANAGTYTVTLTATNNCGSQQFTQTITIGSAPTAGFSSNTTSGCAPLAVTFSDASTGNPTSWNWSFPGGTPANSTLQNPTVTYNSAGTYDVFLTVTNSIGNNSNSQTGYISVTAAPTAAFNNSVSGNTVTFTNSSTGATSYAWDFGDGNTSTMANPVHTYSGPGTYNVTLTATNSCGNVVSTQQVVISGTGPIAAMTSSTTSGCAPLVVNYTDQSSGNPTSWSWNFPGGIPSTSTVQNPTVSYNSVGQFDVTLTVGNASGSNTTSFTNYIDVQDIPNAAFNFSVTGADASFINNTALASTYLWDFGDGNTSTAVNPMHTYTSNGTYTVTLTATNACGTDVHTETVVISVSTALEDQNDLAGLTVMPNPNTGLFQLEVIGKPLEQLEVQVLNVVGVKVHQQLVDFSSGQFTTNIDLGDVPAGTYVLAVLHGKKVNYRKIAIIK